MQSSISIDWIYLDYPNSGEKIYQSRLSKTLQLERYELIVLRALIVEL